MALAIVAFVLITLGQAIGQVDRVLKTVLRPPKHEPDSEPLRSRVFAPEGDQSPDLSNQHSGKAARYLEKSAR
jgi:hypothetical protein